jgi:hypothetical protein
MAAGNFNDVRSLNHLFEKGALFGAAGFRLLGEGAPEQILGARVEPESFQYSGFTLRSVECSHPRMRAKARRAP